MTLIAQERLSLVKKFVRFVMSLGQKNLFSYEESKFSPASSWQIQSSKLRMLPTFLIPVVRRTLFICEPSTWSTSLSSFHKFSGRASDWENLECWNCGMNGAEIPNVNLAPHSQEKLCGRQIKQMLIVYAAFLKIMLFKFKFSFCLACDSNVPFILVKVFILIGTLKLKQVWSWFGDLDCKATLAISCTIWESSHNNNKGQRLWVRERVNASWNDHLSIHRSFESDWLKG